MDRRRHQRFIYRYQKIAYLIPFGLYPFDHLRDCAIDHGRNQMFPDYNTGAFLGFYNYDYILSTDLFLQSFATCYCLP
jgi:hypothetical protein